MPESFKSRSFRWGFNLFPAYRGSGGRVTYIAEDWHDVRVKLPLNWRTRNYVGTIYGGSIYAAIDPIYMLMLMKILGPGYVVWDKAAKIRFRKPARETLYVDFSLDRGEIAEIVKLADEARSVDRIYNVELKNGEGLVHAEIEKTVYIAKKGK
ncbi:MAG: PaaI family thioesterase [Pyrinomonadaceae bacterium]